MSILKFSIRSLASIAVCSFAWAGTITENFTTQLYKDSNETSLIWNIGTGRLHPTQEVDSWKPFNGAMRTTDISFGDGRHGSFDTSTYAQFDDDHDISDGFIRINTNQYPELNVTNFTLESGYILEPVGDKPLIVLSQSDVRILGTAQILCSGKNGEDTKSPESSVSNGGSGRCGGSYGGQGGSYNGGYSASTKGFPQAGLTNPLGGNGGADNGFGGGGGGTYYDAAPPERGYDNNTGGASPVNGTQGSNYDNQDFSILLGGAGGGGGGAYYSGTPADPTNSSGAGGGGVLSP